MTGNLRRHRVLGAIPTWCSIEYARIADLLGVISLVCMVESSTTSIKDRPILDNA